jgi:hypothetical protein
MINLIKKQFRINTFILIKDELKNALNSSNLMLYTEGSLKALS